MSKDLEILSNNDVVAIVDRSRADFVSGNTLKIQQLLEEYKEYIEESRADSNNSNVCGKGIECEVLRHEGNNQGWRQGRIKFVVQFEPDGTADNANLNSLDDIRNRIHTSE